MKKLTRDQMNQIFGGELTEYVSEDGTSSSLGSTGTTSSSEEDFFSSHIEQTQQDLFNQMRVKASHGCKLYVIDNMMKLTADQDNVNKAQCYIISKLKEFAVNYQVHVVIIAHPKKGDGDQSVSGAMEQENTVDTILRFKRVFTTDGLEKGTQFPASQLRRVTALVVNEKVRNGGTQHKMFMEFDHVRQANIDLAYLPNVESLTNSLYKDHLYSRFTTNVDDLGGGGVNSNVF